LRDGNQALDFLAGPISVGGELKRLAISVTDHSFYIGDINVTSLPRRLSVGIPDATRTASATKKRNTQMSLAEHCEAIMTRITAEFQSSWFSLDRGQLRFAAKTKSGN
jgi:hypothetical protein